MSAAVSPPRSHLLVGRVWHRRLRGVDYAFMHRVWYVAVDLDDLYTVNAESRLLAYEGQRVLRILARDHLSRDGALPLPDAVRAHLRAQGLYRPEWRVTLITYPRVLGYVFNPVSFYLCHDPAGELRHVIAEVNNTHGESQVYDFRPAPQDAAPPGGAVFTSSASKRLYVSPFIGSNAEYHLRVIETGDQLAISIHETEGGAPALDAAVRLRRVPLSDRQLLRLLAADPLVPVKTIALIGWHALRMWMRGQRWERFRPKTRYGRD
ncbi:MAG: DUF1365 domain-containing protein [Dehalococcoidia bacterium]